MKPRELTTKVVTSNASTFSLSKSRRKRWHEADLVPSIACRGSGSFLWGSHAEAMRDFVPSDFDDSRYKTNPTSTAVLQCKILRTNVTDRRLGCRGVHAADKLCHCLADLQSVEAIHSLLGSAWWMHVVAWGGCASSWGTHKTVCNCTRQREWCRLYETGHPPPILVSCTLMGRGSYTTKRTRLVVRKRRTVLSAVFII